MNFWDRVNRTATCWLWTGPLKEGRYGSFYFKGKGDRAHRVSWIIAWGDIPKGICVLHKCDNTLCVNPEHLFLGTQLDNIKDRDNKGRCNPGVSFQKGSKHKNAKLTEESILEIRKLASSYTQKDLAKKFSVSIATVNFIVNRKTWTHI